MGSAPNARTHPYIQISGVAMDSEKMEWIAVLTPEEQERVLERAKSMSLAELEVAIRRLSEDRDKSKEGDGEDDRAFMRRVERRIIYVRERWKRIK